MRGHPCLSVLCLPEIEYETYTREQRLWTALASFPIAIIAPMILFVASLGQTLNGGDYPFLLAIVAPITIKMMTLPFDVLCGRCLYQQRKRSKVLNRRAALDQAKQSAPARVNTAAGAQPEVDAAKEVPVVRAKLCSDTSVCSCSELCGTGSANGDSSGLKCALVWLKVGFWINMLLFIGFYATAFQGAPFPLMCGTVMNGTAMNGTAMDGEYSYYPECCGPSIGSAPVTPGALRPSPPPCAASCASYPTDCDEATAITAPGGCVYGCTLDGGGDATTQAWLDGIAASLGCATGVPRVVEGTLHQKGQPNYITEVEQECRLPDSTVVQALDGQRFASGDGVSTSAVERYEDEMAAWLEACAISPLPGENCELTAQACWLQHECPFGATAGNSTPCVSSAQCDQTQGQMCDASVCKPPPPEARSYGITVSSAARLI